MSLFLPAPLYFLGLVLVLGGLLFITIRAAQKKRMVYQWQNEVVPVWSNISEHDFDQLRHHLIQSNRRVRPNTTSPRSASMSEADYGQEPITVRENEVIVVCRKHWTAGLALIPIGLLFIISVGLTIYLAGIDTSAYTAVPLWRISMVFVTGSLVYGIRVFVEWRYVFYMLTNQAIYIIKQPPIWLAFWPGYRSRLPIGKVSLASSIESFDGNTVGYVTVHIETNIEGKGDDRFNEMKFIPEEAEFDVRVNEQIGY